MALIFEFSDYREWIEASVDGLKAQKKTFTRQKVAERIGVQPAYLSNVIKQRSHLSSDQLFLFCNLMKLTETESTYALYLLEHDKSGVAQRKRALKRKIEQIRKEHLKPDKNLRAQKIQVDSNFFTEYYLNPEMKLIHAMMGLENYQNDLDRIAEELGISARQVSGFVEKLVGMKLISKSAKGFAKTPTRIHLPKEAAVREPHQTLLKVRAQQKQLSVEDDMKINFSVTFSADESSRKKVSKAFQSFIERTEKIVTDCDKPTGVYQIFFDFFPWTSSS